MAEKQNTDLVAEAMIENRNRKIIIYSVVVAVIVALISSCVSYYSYHKREISRREAKNMTFLLSKLDKGNEQERKSAIDDLVTMSRGKSAYSGIAGFHLAQLYIADNEISKALFEYDRIQADEKYPLYMRNCAALSLVSARLMYGMIQDKEALDQLDVLINRKDFDFKTSALILKSVILAKTDSAAANATLDLVIYKEGVSNAVKALSRGMKHYNIKMSSAVSDKIK